MPENFEKNKIENNKGVENKENKQQLTPMKKSFWGWYLVAGLIYEFAQTFNKSTIDAVIILVIAITSGFLYYRLKSKIKIENEFARVITTFIILEIIAALSTGFFTSLADNWEKIAVRTPFRTEIGKTDNNSLVQLNQNQATYLSDFQKRWDEQANQIDDNSNSSSVYSNNITICKNLQQLVDERQNKMTEYTNQVKPLVDRYFPNSNADFSQLVSIQGKLNNAYNEVLTARINYYQSILDNKSETEIEAMRSAVNDAIGKVSPIEQDVVQAQEKFKEAVQ